MEPRSGPGEGSDPKSANVTQGLFWRITCHEMLGVLIRMFRLNPSVTPLFCVHILFMFYSSILHEWRICRRLFGCPSPLMQSCCQRRCVFNAVVTVATTRSCPLLRRRPERQRCGGRRHEDVAPPGPPEGPGPRQGRPRPRLLRHGGATGPTGAPAQWRPRGGGGGGGPAQARLGPTQARLGPAQARPRPRPRRLPRRWPRW